mgnify:CR=1 FL=1
MTYFLCTIWISLENRLSSADVNEALITRPDPEALGYLISFCTTRSVSSSRHSLTCLRHCRYFPIARSLLGCNSHFYSQQLVLLIAISKFHLHPINICLLLGEFVTQNCSDNTHEINAIRSLFSCIFNMFVGHFRAIRN